MSAGMLAILGTWLVLLAAFCGIGFVAQRLAGVRAGSAERVLCAFWLGWAIVVVLLQFWHLVAPVNEVTFLVLVIPGLVGLALNARDLARLLRTDVRAKVWYLASVALFAVWLANRAMGPIGPYDAGLYHLNSIRWASEYRIVPGLGCLHGRLAFNCSHFLYLALLGVGPWKGASHHLGNGVLILVTIAQIGLSVARAFMRKGDIQAYDLLRILLLVPVVDESLIYTASTTPDVPVFVLGVVVCVELCRVLLAPLDATALRYHTVLAVTLAGVGITMKLSFAALGVSAALVAIGFVLVEQMRGPKRIGRVLRLAWLAGPAVVAVATWMARGVILSGHFAYPSGLGSVAVEWRISPKHAAEQVRMMTGRHRQPYAEDPNANHDEVLSSWSWVVPWAAWTVRKNWFDVNAPLAVLFGAVLIGLWRRKRGTGHPWRGLLLLVPPVGSLTVWFLTVPHPRYAGAAFWLLGSGAVVIASVRWWSPKYARRVAVAVGVAALLAAAAHHRVEGLVVAPGPDHGFYPIPVADLKTFTTNSGLVLYAPRRGNQCWDAPLPCTPYPSATIRLRRADDMTSGFVRTPPPGRSKPRTE